jgi:hypothetical protein
MRWAGHIVRLRQIRNAYIVLIVKSEGKRSLGRRKLRWEVNFEPYRGDIGWEVVD